MSITAFQLTFEVGAVESEHGAILLAPGIAGPEMLLSAHHAEYSLSTKQIEEAFAVHGWMSDHSFTWKDFKLLVSTLYSFSDPDASDAEVVSKALAELVDVIARRNAEHEFPLIHPGEQKWIQVYMSTDQKICCSWQTKQNMWR